MEAAKLDFIIKKFFINSEVLSINPIDSGLINKTYIVEHVYNGKKNKFILQCLSDIFESHQILIRNHNLVTDHIRGKINNSYFDFDLKRWQSPNLIRCQANSLFTFTFESNVWRAMRYIDKSFSLDRLEDGRMAYQIGIGLAKFHSICSDIDCCKFENSIKNFHNTKYYLDKYIRTLRDYNFINLDQKVNKRIKDLINCLSNHIGLVDFLLTSLSKKTIDRNIIHGDPKLSNFLFDINYKYVVSLIDLDTVSSGYFLTDLSDCIRSICNLAGEDPENKENVFFDMKTCKYFLKGYFSIFMKDKNYSFGLLPEFIYLIIFELTIRFFTDFLLSNMYFKIKYETHNLYRAEIQYRLLSSFIIQIPNLSFELHKNGIFSSSKFVSDVQKFI